MRSSWFRVPIDRYGYVDVSNMMAELIYDLLAKGNVACFETLFVQG